MTPRRELSPFVFLRLDGRTDGGPVYWRGKGLANAAPFPLLPPTGFFLIPEGEKMA